MGGGGYDVWAVRRTLVLVAVAVTGSVCGCSSGSDPRDASSRPSATTVSSTDLGEDCSDAVGEYPPDTITLAVAGAAVAVPWSSWECPGYNADSFIEPVVVEGRAGSPAEIQLRAEEDSRVRVAAHPADGGSWVDLPVESLDGSGWVFALPSEGHELRVRVCSADGRCATYVAVVAPTG